MGAELLDEVVAGGWLRTERDALLDLLGSLGPDEWQVPTECPAWTVQGLVLHVLGDDLSLLARQRDQATNSLLLYAEDHPGLDLRALLDGFNEQWVTAATFLSPALVVELLRLTGEWSAAFYEAVDLDGPSEPVGFFGATGPSPYRQVIGRELVERWVHQHQLRRAVGRPDLGVELLAVVGGVFVSGLAARLGDIGVPEGGRVAVQVPGVAAWTITRTDRGWDPIAGGDGAVAALVLATDAATPVLSRMPGAAGAGAVSTSGDPVVGDALLVATAEIFG